MPSDLPYDPEKLHQLNPLLQSLLGCGWGRDVWSPTDATACEDRADQIVVLHRPDGSTFDVRLCLRHVTAICAETEPHNFG